MTTNPYDKYQMWWADGARDAHVAINDLLNNWFNNLSVDTFFYQQLALVDVSMMEDEEITNDQ